MHPHYFGKSDQPLFGVYHPARQVTSHPRAVLICPPIGHEYLRTHWALRLLAQRLAREGVHVLRFDYTGVGDSSSWIGGTESIGQWVDDICIAAEDLVAESGCKQISIVGLRLGAMLAAMAAERDLPLEHLLLWEPVTSGESYTQDQCQMHQQMLDLWVCPMTTDDDDRGIELLGYYYQRALFNELAALQLAELRPRCDRLTVVDCEAEESSTPLTIQTDAGAEAKRVFVDDTPAWDQLSEIETAWLQSPGPMIDALKSTSNDGLSVFVAPDMSLADTSVRSV